MSKYLRQVNLKLSPEMDEALREASNYLGLKVSEVVRGWIQDQLEELRANRQFQNWKAGRKKDA